MKSKEEFFKKKYNSEKLKLNESKNEYKNISLKKTTFISNNSKVSSQNESFSFDNNKTSQRNNILFFSQNDSEEIKESNNLEDIKKKNNQFVSKIILKDDDEKDGEQKLNDENNNTNFPKKYIKNTFNKSFTLNDSKEEPKLESPTFSNKKEINNVLSEKFVLFGFLDIKMKKILKNSMNRAFIKDNIDTIVNELGGIYRNLIKNENSYCFCCHLFKICQQKHRIKILKELSKTLSDDCLDKYAKYSIQILVKQSSCKEEYDLILCSFNDFNKLIHASLIPNGSEVIKKIIKYIPEEFRMKFNLLFITLLGFIIKYKIGVVIAKTFVDYTKDEEIASHIVNLIRTNFLEIATNKYGNFFIQHTLEQWCNTNKGLLIKQEIIYAFRILFENKNSSFICDLFLKLATIEDKKLLMNSLNLDLKNNYSKTDKIIMIKIIKSFENNSISNNINKNENN